MSGAQALAAVVSPTSFVSEVRGGLEAAGIDCRFSEVRPSRPGDLDCAITVDAASLPEIARTLEARGFVPAPGRVDARRRRFVAYDGDAGGWVRVHVEGLTGTDRPGAGIRRLAAGLAGALPTARRVRRHRGMSVALLAPDGGGKSTLARSLADDPVLRARIIYMGTNLAARTLGFPWTRWLARRARGPETAWPRWGWRGAGYFNRLVEQWYRLAQARLEMWRGRFVVFDRYVYDAVLASRTTKRGVALRRWLLRYLSSTPDLIILLDAPGDVLYQRKGEHSPEVLTRQRQKFLALRRTLPHLIVVDTTGGAEDVRRHVTALIWERYRTRTRGTASAPSC